MNYEKKYKEALARATKLHSEPTGGTKRIVCEQIFPELMVSEDEKIRKVLIDYFKRYKEQEECGIKTFYGIPADDILAWLEKQGEQKLNGTFVNVDDVREGFIDEVYRVLDADPTNDRANQIIDAFDNLPTVTIEKQGAQPRYNIGDVICDKSCTTLNKEAQPNMEIVDIQNGMYICDKGSFPVSQQDEYELVYKKIDTKLNDDSVSNELRKASFAHAEREMKNQTFPDNLEFELIYTFEKGAKWDAAQKPTWSEEDEEILRTIISDGIRGAEFDMLQIDWLKSIKNRYAWKPSDEQMDALDGICSYIRNKADWEISQDMVSDLYKLSEQLKKLRGEKQ